MCVSVSAETFGLFQWFKIRPESKSSLHVSHTSLSQICLWQIIPPSPTDRLRLLTLSFAEQNYLLSGSPGDRTEVSWVYCIQECCHWAAPWTHKISILGNATTVHCQGLHVLLGSDPTDPAPPTTSQALWGVRPCRVPDPSETPHTVLALRPLEITFQCNSKYSALHQALQDTPFLFPHINF